MVTPNPTAASPVDTLLDRLDNVRTVSGGHTARCPAHDDRHNSLKVDQGNHGEALVFCHAGCATEAVVAAVGLRLADLFPDASQGPRFAANGAAPDSGRNGHGPSAPPAAMGPIVAEYPYPEADGTTRFRVTRHQPKTFRP